MLNIIIANLLAMATDMKGKLTLKLRSKSMPLIRPSAPASQITKPKNSKQTSQDQGQRASQQSHKIFDIETLKNRQFQEIHSKIKVLAERSLKKLQEKYETVDRWKQRYQPQSSLLRHKLGIDSSAPSLSIDERSSEPNEHSSQYFDRLFPMIIKHQPLQKEQGRKLEEALRERLQRNKKYYKLKNTLQEKQISNFEHMNLIISQDKKRELQLRMLLLRSEKERTVDRGFFFKKLSLEEPITKEKSQRRPKEKRLQQLPRQASIHRQNSLGQWKNSSLDLNELKEKLMQEAICDVPQGWITLNQQDSPEQSYLS